MRSAAARIDESCEMPRRKMVLETVQEVLLVHDITEKRFHMSVARMDERGHQYAVMIDLYPDVSGQPEMSPQEWLNMEQRITQLVMSRYRIKVTHVYWRLDSVPTAKPSASPAIQAKPAASAQTNRLVPMWNMQPGMFTPSVRPLQPPEH